MTSHTVDINAYGTALSRSQAAFTVEQIPPLQRALFVGSGDSLASGGIAVAAGHSAMSSGDVAWTGKIPTDFDTLVGISHSGTSAATVRALQVARQAGLRTVAVTSQPASPLASSAHEVQLVPTMSLHEPIPYSGHVMLAIGVASLCGIDAHATMDRLQDCAGSIEALTTGLSDALPSSAPSSLSILTLPDLRSAGDFWSLKFIEATGVSARSVPLEESGHVDYFIGPQRHLAVGLVGTLGLPRFERLLNALQSTGQQILHLDATTLAAGDKASDRTARDIASAVLGAMISNAAAARWNRPLFRGGAINMDARHIKLDGDDPSE